MSNIENSSPKLEIIQNLKNQVELRNKWLSLIAHDFKGIFSNILWVIEAFENEILTLDEFLSMLPEIKQRAQINQKTLNDTFDWINTDLLDSSPQFIELNIFNLVAETVTSLDEAISNKNITIHNLGDQTITLVSNKLFLQFILKKLLENAIKYSHIKGEVEIEILSRATNIHLFIKDKGIGMDSKKLSTVFTLDGAVFIGTQNEKGVGLSLVIVNDFMKMLGGEIDIYPNSDNIGVVVELRFPIL